VLFLCKSFLSLSLSFLPPPLSSRHHERQVFLLFANPRPKFSFFHLFFFSRTRDREMKTRAAFCGGKKKSTLFSSVVSKKRCFKKCFHCVFSAENVINIYTFRTSSIYTHTAGTRAHHRLFLSLQSFARMMFKKKKNTLLLFLSFFLYSHPRVHKLFSIIIIHNNS